MSKGNLFLGFARGKVGDVVFSHLDGEQITRARNRAPRNPQTPTQLLQRVCLKTSSCAFSGMQEIVNHSFQGSEGVTANQSQFTVANVKVLRERLAAVIGTGDDADILTSSDANYSLKGSRGVEINPYVMSYGSLPSVEFQHGVGGHIGCVLSMPSDDSEPTAITYQMVVDQLGLKKGDQLTFVWLGCDDTEEGANGLFNSFAFARVILEPSDGDMSAPFLASAGGLLYSVNLPNEKNQGDLQFNTAVFASGSSSIILTPVGQGVVWASGTANSWAAGCCIVSREGASQWLRSSSSLYVRSWLTSVIGHLSWDHSVDLLGDAVLSYMTESSSSLYLNQAQG